MPAAGVYEAKASLARLIRRAERGERIVITRHGKPVAELGPARDRNLDDIARAIARLTSFRASLRPGRLRMKELIEEGRRR